MPELLRPSAARWPALAALALLPAACGSGSGGEATPTTEGRNTPAATVAAPLEQPPPATITLPGGTKQEAGLGTYCWTSARGLLCGDVPGVVTPDTAATTDRGVTVAFETGAPAPASLSVAWLTTGTSVPDKAGPGHVMWPGPPASMLLASGPAIEAPGVPGRYVLLVAARWPGGRDAIYGFFIELR